MDVKQKNILQSNGLGRLVPRLEVEKPVSDEPIPGDGRSLVDTMAAPFKSVGRWVKTKTTPEADTAGNYIKGPYVPAILEGAIEGFALRGVPGGITSMACAAVSVFVQDKTSPIIGKTAANLLAMTISVATGAGLAATLWPAAGPAARVHNTIAGGLLGAFQTFRADKTADVRGAGSFGTFVAGTMISGSGKVAAGLGSAIGRRFFADKPLLKALTSAGVAGAIGATLALIGFTPVGLTVAAAAGISAVAGGIGSFVGPYYSQFFRNIAKDIGKVAEKGMKKLHLIKNNLPPRIRNCIGAFPSGGLKEGLTGLVYADGNIIGLIAGVGMEAVHQISVFVFSHVPEEAKDAHGVTAAIEGAAHDAVQAEDIRTGTEVPGDHPPQPALEAPVKTAQPE